MICVLAQRTSIDKIIKIVRKNKGSESICEVAAYELPEMSHIETLVVDWNCHYDLRSLYKEVAIDDLVFVVGDQYIDSSDSGKKILMDQEKKALEEQKWNICKIINHIRTEFSFWREDIVLENYPNIIQIESTNICNAKCIMCKHLISNNYKGGFVTIDVLKNMSGIFPYVDIVILHGFGEPFLVPQLKDMLDYYQSYGIKLITNTNLSVLPNEVVPVLNDTFFQINISCDGCTKSTFEGIRKGIKFEDFNNNMMILKENCPDVRLVMNTVMMRQNLMELSDIVKYAKKMGFEEIVFMPITVAYSLDNYADGLTNYPQITYKVIEDIKLTANQENIKVTVPDLKINFCEEEYWKELERFNSIPMFKSDEEIELIQERAKWRLENSNENKYVEIKASNTTCKGICDWLVEKTFVDLKGNVYFCCMNNDHSDEGVAIDFKIGNVCEEDFLTIWNGQQYKKIREMFYGGDLPDVCVGCQFLINKTMKTIDINVDGNLFLTRKG